MVSDTTQLIVAVFRALLVVAVLYFFGRRINSYIDSIPPKNKFLHKISRKDKKVREFIVKNCWLVGLIIFTINILILYLLKIYN